MQRRSLLPVFLLLAVITLSLWPSCAEAELAASSLERITAHSSLVFVGRVERMIEVPVKPLDDEDLNSFTTATLAKVTVLEWFKGARKTKTLWFWATGAWEDDISMAIKGEVAVFFLEGPSVESLVTAESVKRVHAATRGAPVYRLAMSGRGRMPIREIAGKRYATVWSSDARLPADFDTIPGPDPRFTAFIRGVHVGDVRRLVKRSAKKVPKEQRGPVVDLLTVVNGPFDESRDEAMRIIADRGARAVPVLLRVLRDAESPLRESASELLGGLDECGGAVLAKGLASKDVRDRRAAAFAVEWLSRLSAIWEDDFHKRVFKGLRDPDPQVRGLLLQGLDLNHHDEALLVAALAAALKDASINVRRSATWILRSDDLDVRKAAARKALESGLLALAASPDLPLRRSTWEALANRAGPAAWTAAQRGLADADPVVRVNAASTLARVSSPAASQRLIALLRDKDAWVRRAAAHALGLSPAKEGVSALVQALGDSDRIARRLAAWALGEMGTQAAAAVPALEKLLKAEGDTVMGYEISEALENIR